MECKETGLEFDTANWSGFANLRRLGDEYSSSCPCLPAGRDATEPNYDRLTITPAAGQRGQDLFWCRHCHAGGENGHGVKEAGAVNPKREFAGLPVMHIIETFHITAGSRLNYFRARGINDEQIGLHKLGFNHFRGLFHERYSIPCFVDGMLSAVQYRIPDESWESYLVWCKRTGARPAKYLSERGGNNSVLFNTRIIPPEGLPYLLYIESPLDTLALASLGFPAISMFMGNNRGVGWKKEWSRHIEGVEEIIVVPDNDREHQGELIAQAKLMQTPRSRGKILPPMYKDTGKFIESLPPETARQEIAQWLGLPPIL